jgi:hypothetical protein
LQFYSLLEEIHSHQCRLAALPSEGVDTLVCVHIAFYYLLENLFGHPVPAGFRIQITVIQIEAVGASEVTVRRGRFDKKRKLFGSIYGRRQDFLSFELKKPDSRLQNLKGRFRRRTKHPVLSGTNIPWAPSAQLDAGLLINSIFLKNMCQLLNINNRLRREGDSFFNKKSFL